jgi:hypothetical protein
MLTTITLIFSFLVALNFLLLKYSCNKTIQRKSTEKSLVIEKRPTVVTTPQLSNQLARTGS